MKFRIFDKDDGKLFIPDESVIININKDKIYYSWNRRDDDSAFFNIDISEFTGMLDTNTKEVYENDIVIIETLHNKGWHNVELKDIGIVKFLDYQWIVKTKFFKIPLSQIDKINCVGNTYIDSFEDKLKIFNELTDEKQDDRPLSLSPKEFMEDCLNKLKGDS